MPELPEVEVLVRHLAPLLPRRAIRRVDVRRERVVRPDTPARLVRQLTGARFLSLERRGKYLVFELTSPGGGSPFRLLAHLGMTGRIYLAPAEAPLAKHAAVVLELDRETLVFEDTRYFGRFTLDLAPLGSLGPEPLGPEFTPATLQSGLAKCRQPIKTKLLDQALVAGIGNIYASEALHRAGISPRAKARRLKIEEIRRLWRELRAVLREAIRLGSTIPLNFGPGGKDGLFYYGSETGQATGYEERLRVYDRENHACFTCGSSIKRLVQAGRATFYCPKCQALRSPGRAKLARAG
jgi:formamidopyrimidine-DNA glycosylase